MTVHVTYRNPEGVTAELELEGDPFDVCDRAQRKLFPVLLEDGWARLLEHRKRRDAAERAKK